MQILPALSLFLAACAAASGAQAQATPPAAATAAKSTRSALPLVDGEVRKVDAQRALIVLRHGDLPNLGMPPMTMGFEVADRKMLDRVKVGDKVRFQAGIVAGRATITELQAAAR